MVLRRLATLSLLLTFIPALVHALRNITIDDTDSNIVYKGIWEPDKNHLSDLDYGGSHTVSEDPTASATFNFTGVAIYYLAPKWPYLVNTRLTLDGGSPETVDLTDLSTAGTSGGEETVQSSVVWSFTGLKNTQHTLVATLAPAGAYIIMDGLIYTIVDTNVSSTGSPTPATSLPATTSASSAASSSSSSKTDPVAIGVGLGVGLVALILACLAIYFFLRHRRLQKADDAREVPTNVPVIVAPYYTPPSSGMAAEPWTPANTDPGSRPTSTDNLRKSKDSSAMSLVGGRPTLASVISSSPSPRQAEFDPRSTYSGSTPSPPVNRTSFQEPRLDSPPPPAYSPARARAHGIGKV